MHPVALGLTLAKLLQRAMAMRRQMSLRGSRGFGVKREKGTFVEVYPVTRLLTSF